jgi:hypothetical protein
MNGKTFGVVLVLLVFLAASTALCASWAPSPPPCQDTVYDMMRVPEASCRSDQEGSFHEDLFLVCSCE